MSEFDRSGDYDHDIVMIIEEEDSPSENVVVDDYVSSMLIAYRLQIKNNNDKQFYAERSQHRSDNFRAVCGRCTIPGVDCIIIKVQEWTPSSSSSDDKFEDIMIFDVHEWNEFVSWLQKFCDDHAYDNDRAPKVIADLMWYEITLSYSDDNSVAVVPTKMYHIREKASHRGEFTTTTIITMKNFNDIKTSAVLLHINSFNLMCNDNNNISIK